MTGPIRDTQDLVLLARENEALRLELARLTALIGSIDEIVFEFDELGTYVNVWTANEQLLARPRNELLGRRAGELMGEEFERPFLDTYRQVLRTGQAQTVEYVLDVMAGRRWFLARISPAPAGGPRGTVMVLSRDITERKQAEEALRSSESRLAEAQRVAHLGSWEWDIATDTVTWSDELYRIYGLEPQQFRATYEGFLERVHPDDRERAKGTVDQAYVDQKPFEYDHRICRPDGTVANVHSRAHVIVDAVGRTARMIGTAQDVTESSRLAAELRLLETISLELLEAPDQLAALSIALRGICQATGWLLGQAWTKNVAGNAMECSRACYASVPSLRSFHAASEALSRPLGVGLIGRVWSAREPLWLEDVTRDPGFTRAAQALAAGLRAGLAAPVFVGDEPVAVLEFFANDPLHEDPHVRGLVVAVCAELGNAVGRQRAEADRKRLFSEVQESHEQLRALTARLERVREEERAWIAREIHDELGQALTALKMDVAGIERRLRGSSSEESVAQVLTKTAEMKTAIDDAIERVRQMSSKLRPAMLDDLGLSAAVSWLAQDFERRTGIRCRVRTKVDDSALGWDVSTAAFRILQEALTNTARHAQAERVAVSLTASRGRLALQVGDDGKGIEEGQLVSRDSLGLLGMRERASRLGGELRIAGRRGSGTTVTVTLPLPAREKAAR